MTSSGVRDEDFDAFLRIHAAAFLKLAYLLAGNMADAEELFQDAMATAYVRRLQVTAAMAPRAYVRQILVNTHRRRYRHKRAPELLDGHSRSPADHDVRFSQVDDRTQLGPALAQLPVGQRTVVVLRCCEDLSEKEVAALLDCGIGTVKSQLSKGLTRMRALLSADTPDISAEKGYAGG